MNVDYNDIETQKAILIEYLKIKVAMEDWHGVADAAMDIRELDASRKSTNKSQS